MLLRGCVAIVLLQICSGFDWCSLTCDGGVKHTMCVYKAGGGDSCEAVKTGLTAKEKQTILDYHNQLRAEVANGKEKRGSQPSAADMNQLVWDEEVAGIAQRWVDQCKQLGGHDQCRITRDKVQVGQNYAESSGYGMSVDRISMIKRLVKSWYDEVKDMDPSSVAGIQFGGPVVGHYTQVVWGKTTRLGCGLAHKQEGEGGEFKVRLVCNYKVAGNFIGEPVYTEGEAATECAKKSTKYPGLCEPQEEGDRPESDASAPSSSSSGSSSAGSSSGPSKPDAFTSSGFSKPVSTYASTGYPAEFASSGFPQAFASMGSFQANPYQSNVQTHQFFNQDTDKIPGFFSSSPKGKQSTKVKRLGSVQTHQFFNQDTDKIPGFFSSSPKGKQSTKVKRLGSVQTHQFFNQDTDKIPGFFSSSPKGKQSTKVKRLGSVQTQFFKQDTDTIPGFFSSSPKGKQSTKVHTVITGPMSASDLHKLLLSRMYDQNK